MRRIKEILLQQYIGAILIGLLAAYGMGDLLSALLQPLAWLLLRGPMATIYPAAARDFGAGRSIETVATGTLHLFVAGLIFWWLYRRATSVAGAKESTSQP